MDTTSLKDGAATQRQLHEEILKSTSWKISAPVRMVGRQFPKFARLSRTVLPLQLKKETSEWNRLIQEILNSTSWKISAPIRVMGRWFPKLAYVGRRTLLRLEMELDKANALVPSTDQLQQHHFECPPENSSTSYESQTSATMGSIIRFGVAQNQLKKQLILVAADVPPMFDRQSGALRLYTIMRILFEAGWHMTFASHATQAQFDNLAGSAAERKRYESLLSKIGIEKIVYGREEINAFLEAEGAAIRCAFLSFPGVAHNLIPWVTVHAPWARIIYDMVDFHYLRMMREADLKSNEEIRASALQMRDIELANARTSNVTLAVSEDERQAILKLDSGVVVEVIPNIFEIPADCDPGLASRKDLLFVGGFLHAPNIDAVQWFAEQVWPLIHQQRPSLKFIIAGSSATQEVLALADRPGIEVAGYVEDLTPLFRCARAFVAPLRYGAGVKGKVGQSMAQGLPVVATKVAGEGMNAVVGKDLLVADEPTDFAAAVIKLLDDDTLWLQLRANGRKLIGNTQSVEAARTKLGDILNG